MNERATTDAALPAAHAAAAIERAAAIAATGLPLGSGLRAAAQDSGSAGLSRALRNLAGQIERGQTLDAILASSRGIPKHLRGVLVAAQRSGQFGPVLAEWMGNRQAAAQHWRSLQMALVYPLLLFFMTAGLYLAFLMFVVRPFKVLFDEFGLRLPIWTQILVSLSGVGVEVLAIVIVGTLVILVGLRLVGGRAGWSWLMSGLPLVGPAWHFAGVAEMLRGLAILVEHRLPLAEALRLAGGGASDEYVGSQCLKLARRVEQGAPLWSALIELRTLPVSIVPLVRWGEMHDSLGEALRTAAEMLEGRLRLRSGVLIVVLPPVLLILVGAMVCSLLALYLPLITLIQGLT
jgi:type II secretory pathway component PulF